MKFSCQLVAGSLAVLVLSACSSNPQELRQAKDDFAYLDTAPMQSWTIPEGAEPQFYPNYDIPQGNYSGAIGRNVDIRPPQQVLGLIPGARAEVTDGDVTLWFMRDDEAQQVWQVAQDVVTERGILLREGSTSRLETDWVSWASDDEEQLISARYVLEKFNANNRVALKLVLVEWRSGERVLTPSEVTKERFTAYMANEISIKYDQELRAEAQLKAQQLVKNIPLSMGSDRSGLKVIIVRAPFSVFWERAAELLPQIGFELEERNGSQGQIKAKFEGLDDDYWAELGAEPLELRPIVYSFALGDLGNRTSVALSEPDGKPAPDEALEALLSALQVVIDGNSKAE
jgi:outer membrane protein assembly factor BamC